LAFSYNAYSEQEGYNIHYNEESKLSTANKNPSLPISLSNNYSEMGTDLILSGVGLSSYINDKYELNQNIFARFFDWSIDAANAFNPLACLHNALNSYRDRT
jgi:hypothetical protein